MNKWETQILCPTCGNIPEDGKECALILPLVGKWNKKVKTAWVPVDFWTQKLKNDENFYFIKINHGIFDMMNKIPNLKDKTARQIAVALYSKRNPGNKSVHRKTYIKMMMLLITYIRQYDNISRNIYIGLGNTSGIRMSPGRNNRSLSIIVNPKTKRHFLYAGLVRRYTVANEIPSFLKEAKDSGYHVHIIGPTHCKHYKKIIPGPCTHHPIMYQGALGKLDKLINKLEKTLTGKDLLLTSLTTGTFLFYAKLKARNLLEGISLMDLGRAFDFTMRDHPSVSDQPWLKKFKSSPQFIQLLANLEENGYMAGYEKRGVYKTNNF